MFHLKLPLVHFVELGGWGWGNGLMAYLPQTCWKLTGDIVSTQMEVIPNASSEIILDLF